MTAQQALEIARIFIELSEQEGEFQVQVSPYAPNPNGGVAYEVEVWKGDQLSISETVSRDRLGLFHLGRFKFACFGRPSLGHAASLEARARD